MSPLLILPATAAVAALIAVDIGSATTAPAVSVQKTWTGARSPVTVPGTGLRQGAAIPMGARLVYRDVSLTRGQQPRFRLTAGRTRTLRGLAPAEKAKVGFAVVRPARYAGGRSVLVRAFAARGATGRVGGRIYALAR